MDLAPFIKTVVIIILEENIVKKIRHAEELGSRSPDKVNFAPGCSDFVSVETAASWGKICDLALQPIAATKTMLASLT